MTIIDFIAKFKRKIGNIFILSIPAVMIVIVTQNEVREYLRDLIQPDYRKLVSTVIGDVLGDGTPIQVTKVKTRDALFLEIYKPSKSGARELIQRIKLDEQKDAYFTLKGKVINLAIDDVYGDHTLEIIAPAFDQNLTAHLNIYKYDKNSKLFYKMMSQL